ncbi:MAG: T9SS type A sorting domain-containing protein [Bacteroidia bacterium]|nr:T9SS type A sorting domain-containing protein [Bacteroidia bacterium]
MKKATLIIAGLLFNFIVINAQTNLVWKMGMNISTGAYGNMHPRIVLDGKGNPLVIWGRMSDASVMFSRWTGTAFTTPVKLNPSWLSIATATWMGPDIASKGDTVYVVVKRIPEASDTNHIYLIRSFNGGISFFAPVRIDLIADSISRFPAVTVDATGNPMVAFMKFNSSFLDSRWVVTKSIDYGISFSPDIKASGWSGAKAEVCDCCPGAIISDGNVTSMLYRDNLSNKRDIWTGISTNNNVSFSDGFATDNSNWMLMSCPSSGPDGVIIGDTLYTVFLSGAGGKNKNYISKSSVSENKLKSISPLTGSITGLTQQNFPRIASDGIAAAIVWKQTVNGNDQLPLLFTNNIAKGFTVYDTVDLNDITNADVAVNKGNIFVVWEDDNSGTVKFRQGTYKYVTTGIPAQVTDPVTSINVFPNPVNDVLNIVSPSGENYVLNIYNSLGEKMFTMESSINLLVPTSTFPSGIYFIEWRTDKLIHNQKIIKP